MKCHAEDRISFVFQFLLLQLKGFSVYYSFEDLKAHLANTFVKVPMKAHLFS